MIWGFLVGGLVFGWIGAMMLHEGDNVLTRWLGLFLVLNAGILLGFGFHVPEAAGYIQPDKDKCSHYVFVNDELTCVPYGEEG